MTKVCFFKNSVPAVQDIKKYAQNLGFIFVDFGPDPLARSGTLKIPSGTPPGPRASALVSARRFAPHSGLRFGPRARRGALGVFENPLRASGDLEQNPLKKTRIFYIYFCSHISQFSWDLCTVIPYIGYVYPLKSGGSF